MDRPERVQRGPPAPRAGHPGVGEKVVACQMEYSPFEPENENSGVLDAARELGVGVVAYSPLGSGEWPSFCLLSVSGGEGQRPSLITGR